MINSCLTSLQTVALLEHLENDRVFGKTAHDGEFRIVDRTGVVAAVELFDSILLSSLIQINDPCVKHLSDPCCALTMQIYRRLIFIQINFYECLNTLTIDLTHFK